MKFTNPQASLPLTNGVNPPWANELLERLAKKPLVISLRLPMIRGIDIQAATTIRELGAGRDEIPSRFIGLP